MQGIEKHPTFPLCGNIGTASLSRSKRSMGGFAPSQALRPLEGTQGAVRRLAFCLAWIRVSCVPGLLGEWKSLRGRPIAADSVLSLLSDFHALLAWDRDQNKSWMPEKAKTDSKVKCTGIICWYFSWMDSGITVEMIKSTIVLLLRLSPEPMRLEPRIRILFLRMLQGRLILRSIWAITLFRAQSLACSKTSY